MAYYFKCPSCNNPYYFSVWPNPLIIGPGRRQCRTCKADFTDGSIEWKTLTKRERFDFLAPIPYKIFLGIMLIVQLVTIKDIGKISYWRDFLAVGMVALILWLPYGLFSLYIIHKSKGRSA